MMRLLLAAVVALAPMSAPSPPGSGMEASDQPV
jgi:hypothetical protein